MLASQAVPIFAFAPLLIIWLGFGIEPKVVVVALGVFFPVGEHDVGLREVDGMLALMRTFGGRASGAAPRASAEQRPVPGTRSPGRHDLRRHRRRDQRVDRARSGIGRVMVSANSIARTDQLFAAMFIVTVVALFLVGLVGLVGRRLTRWQRVGD